MRIFLGLTLLAITISFGFSQHSMAVCSESAPDVFTCDTNPPNPDPNGVQQAGNNNNLTVNVLPGAGIDTVDDEGIRTANGDDVVTVDNGTIEVFSEDGINVWRGKNVVNVTDSTITVMTDSGSDAPIEGLDNTNTFTIIRSVITGGRDGINTGDGIDTITLVDSSLFSGQEGMQLTGGDDIVDIKGSIVEGGEGPFDEGIEFASGNDTLTVEDSRVSGTESIDGGGGNDLMTFNTGANITDLIDCGEDFDTLVFAMDVPEDLVTFISSQILQSDPAADSIEINGLTYEWIDCEMLVAELSGGAPVPVRPIPTLSEWGMIAMAGILGLAGLMVVRRRVAT